MDKYNHEVDLLAYLPPYLQEYREVREIMGAENPEFNLVWKNSDETRDNLFILTADETGIRRYERMLGIIPPPDDTLEARRTRIILIINEQLPYTLRSLSRRLTAIVGAENFGVILKHTEYRLIVNLFRTSIPLVLFVSEMLRQMVPANLTLNAVLNEDPIELDIYAGSTSHGINITA